MQLIKAIRHMAFIKISGSKLKREASEAEETNTTDERILN
jgi:hypothetical protein